MGSAVKVALAGLFVRILCLSCAYGQDSITSSQVSALFIFGDSLADCGNNNNLLTIGRSNFPPYGRDFDTRHATGRFSNGRMVTDYIAEFVRVPLVPAYLSPEANMNLLGGANFASAGSGILNNTGNVLGQKLSFSQQITLFLERRQNLTTLIGEESASQIFSSSLYYIAIGGNDYIHNYITNDSDVALLPHDQFNQLILSKLAGQLKMSSDQNLSKDFADLFQSFKINLYDAGARKVVVIGIGPVGCCPHFLWAINSTNGECLSIVNGYVEEYNTNLRAMLLELNTNLTGANFLYRDTYDIVLQLSKNPRFYGFEVGDTACCGSGNYGGGERCLFPTQVCDNPSSFVWWDEYHPSDRANLFIATQIWSGSDPAPVSLDRSFITLQQLVSM